MDIGAVEGVETPRSAVTYTVTSLANTIANDGVLTFIEAFMAANYNIATGDAVAGSFTGKDRIVFSAGLTGTVKLTGSALTILGSVDIDATSANIIFDGGYQSGVFIISSGINVSLNNVTVTRGCITGTGGSASHGGGIHNSGTLTVTNCTIQDNLAYFGGGGGGIYSYGTLTVTNCTISGNDASDFGGGIYNDGTLTVTNSTISGNNACYGGGGGIYSDGTLTVTNCTISGNTAFDDGGGIHSDGTLTVTNCTISRNTATEVGGGIVSDGTTTLRNTILVGNTAAFGNDIYRYNGTVQGYNNLTSYIYWSGSYGNNIVYNATLPLFVDAANGDYRIQAGSQARNAGSNTLAAVAGLTATSKDRAGNARIVENIIDIGAYEYQTSTKLGAPTLGTVSTTSSSAISVSWAAVTNASGYTVQYATNTGFTTGVGTVSINSGSTLSTSITGLSANTTYYVRILAKGNGTTYIDSDSSAAKNALTYPGTPTNLRSTAQTANSITVAWNAPVGSAASYKLEWSANGTSNWTQIGGTLTGTSYTHSSLTATTTYHYRVLAVNTTGNSAYSANASAMTAVQPAVPANLRSTSTGKTAIQIEWNKVTGATQYVLQRKGPGDSNFVTIYTGTDAKYSDTNRVANTTYQYRVQATNGAGGMSSFTAAVSVKTLAATAADVPMVTGAVFAADSKSATVTWDNLGASYRYQIYRNGVLLTPTAISANSLLDTNPAAANRYIIVGYDVNAPVRNQSMPFVLTSNTIVPEIANHTVANGKITLNWDLSGISNVQAVRVYRNGILLLNVASAVTVTDQNPTLSPRGNYEYILYVVYQEAGKSITTFSSTYAIPQSGLTSSASSLSLLDSIWSDLDFIEELSLV